MVDVTTASGQTTTINNAGLITSIAAAPTSYGQLAIIGRTGNVTVNNAGTLLGRVNFSNLTGTNKAIINNTSFLSWHVTGANVFSGGDDQINNSGLIATNSGGAATSMDFGAGNDTFNNLNSGVLTIGEPVLAASALTLTNLEAFNNSGLILLGSANNLTSDGQTNDQLLAGISVFTGSGNSTIALDASLGAASQTSCTIASSVADCIAIGSSAGSTKIRVNDTNAANVGAYNPTGIVVVDGSTAAGNFKLDPTSTWYNANKYGGVLDKPGMFFYDLAFNGHQHLLIGAPKSETWEFATIPSQAQQIWYATTPWLERQADLRDSFLNTKSSQGAEPGLWMKGIGDWSHRDDHKNLTIYNKSYDTDVSFDTATQGIMGGIDYASHNAYKPGDVMLGGFSMGYLTSNGAFKASSTKDKFDGLTFGAYGTYIHNQFFLDASFKADLLNVKHDVPTLAYYGKSDVNTWGGRLETGMRLALGPGQFEPLVDLAFAKTNINDFGPLGGTIHYKNLSSLRAGVGGRYSATVAATHNYTLKIGATARVWDEFMANNRATLISTGPNFDFSDKFNGLLGDVSTNLNMYSRDGKISAFINAGMKFRQAYVNPNLSFGMRYQW